MADKIIFASGTAAQTLYAILYRSSDGQAWHVGNAAFEAFNPAHWTNYAIALTTLGTGAVVNTASQPGALSNAFCEVSIHLQAGGNPSISDTLVGEGTINQDPANNHALVITAGGVASANLTQILGTALTETAGLLAAGFKKLFNIVTPTLTIGGIDQTGDNFTRLGAPAEASIAADIAVVAAPFYLARIMMSLTSTQNEWIVSLFATSATLQLRPSTLALDEIHISLTSVGIGTVGIRLR